MDDKRTENTLRDFAAGRITWAELEGFSAEQAMDLARRGCAFADAGCLEQALAIFEGLVAVNPKDAHAWAALGTVYDKQENWEASQAAYRQSLALQASEPVALAGLGLLSLRRGDASGKKKMAAARAADPSGKTEAGRRAAKWLESLAPASQPKR